MYKNLIFDLDNTLCYCSHYYIDAKNEVVEYVHELTGVPKTILSNILNHIDGECTALPNGFNRTRFPRSFAAMCAAARRIANMPTSAVYEERAFDIGDAVFNKPYDLFLGAADMLRAYKTAGFNLFLYTLGDYDVQRRKIEKNGLDKIFGAENIYIVPKKEGNMIDKIRIDHKLGKEDTIMIGDSLRGDIGSANDAGIDSVWVNDGDTGKWHYENVEATPTWTICHINELERIIPHGVNTWLL